MNATDLIAQIKIASPCHARWEDMTGDERWRFCARCQKHVYNFSSMTAEAVAELVRAKEGRLCGRFYRRADGTMLTTDCPVGMEKYSRRLKLLAGSAVALFFASLTVRAWSGGEGGPLAQKCDEVIWKVKGWFGLKPPVFMGVISVTPAPPKPVTAPGTGQPDATKPPADPR